MLGFLFESAQSFCIILLLSHYDDAKWPDSTGGQFHKNV